MSARQTSPSSLVWLLLAAALLLRAAVPAGWMPAAEADGLRIKLCSGSGPVDVFIEVPRTDSSAQHGSGDGGREPHDPCPFGLALGQALDLPAPPLAILPPAATAALVAPAIAAVRLVAWRSLRPPAMGPPNLA